MNGPIGREYVAVCMDIPADVAGEVEEWMGDAEGGEPWDWGIFIEAAWAIVPAIQAAYGVYVKAQEEGQTGRPVMTLEEFAEHSVYEWFK